VQTDMTIPQTRVGLKEGLQVLGSGIRALLLPTLVRRGETQRVERTLAEMDEQERDAQLAVQ